MRKVLFIASHLGSGSIDLFNLLKTQPRIDGFHLNQTYDHITAIQKLISQIHKEDNSAAIYMDELLYNHSLTYKDLYKTCKFIYLIKVPSVVLSNIVIHQPDYSLESASSYYCFRLSGLHYSFQKTSDVIFLDGLDDLSLIENYLGLDLDFNFSTSSVDVGDVEECQKCYEKYLDKFRHI